MTENIELHIDQDKSTGEIQVSIHDASGGYRLAGPKYVGNSRSLLTHVLDKRDLREILTYLSHDFQHPPGGGYLCWVCNVESRYHGKKYNHVIGEAVR